MPRYARGGIRWIVQPRAKPVLDVVRAQFPSEADYLEDKRELQDFLCAYFSDIGCHVKLGDGISPIGGTARGGQVLKVRWNRPGQGKSGALRLIVVGYCDALEVRIAGAYLRARPATANEIAEAIDDL